MNKKSLLIILPVALVLSFFASLMSWGIPKQDNQLYELRLDELADGTYSCTYKIVPPFGTFVANRRVTVEVTVAAHKITGVKLLRPPAVKGIADEFIPRILKEQTTQLDGFSGATWSKRAFLKSVELAVNTAAAR
jgi:uncharacterized protein with FMN-binding domain